jgi:PBP1b-binding outer membrane lipoprotein LpoB
MKKVVLSLAFVAAMFVSCKENAAETTETVDSTAVEAPAVEEAPAADSTAVATDSAAAPVEAAPAQ